jgi:hypothetical protein
LTHFNRIFRQIAGEAPTGFRDHGTSEAKGMARNRAASRLVPEALSAGVIRLAALSELDL